MWEDNLGKVKTKRTKNSKPYERPKSILRRVTDSVTGLLPQPSWLANWLQSAPPEKDNNDDVDTEEEQPVPSTSTIGNETNSIQEGSTRESFIFRRPPGANKEQSNGRTPTSVPAVNLFPESVMAEPPPREQIPQTNGDDDSNSESTSGCSSLLPHLEHKRESRNTELQNLAQVEPLSVDQSSLQIIGSSLSQSLAIDLKGNRGRKTLSLHTFTQDNNLGVTPTEDVRFHKEIEAASCSFFDKDDSSMNRSANKRDLSLPQFSAFSSKRPRFNITSFGPTAAEARRSLLNESVADSPFYAGRTTYGGASAYRRATLQPSTTLFPYVRKRMQARPSSISSAPPTPSGSTSAAASSKVVLSSSAQRILQALESMSTPVRDAKRIPGAASSRRSTSIHDEDVSFSGFGLNRRRPNLGPPASKLSVGTPAQVMSRPTPATKSVAEAAPVSSTPISTQAGGKMRTRKSAPVRESAVRIREEEEDELVGPELTAVPMPIGLSSLPSFSLLPPPPVVKEVSVAAPAITAKLSSSTAPLTTSTNGMSNTCLPISSASRPAFTFSAPLVTVSPHEAAAAVSSKPPSFNFSSPLPVKPVLRKTPEKETSFKPVAELKTGSVMDVLKAEKESKPAEVVTKPPQTATSWGFGDKFKAPADTWTCSVCCVTNPNDKAKCVACESPGPASSSKAASVVQTTTSAPPVKGFGDQFKMTTSQWECSVCMVRNSDQDSRCKSCEEPRPGVKPVSTPSAVSTFKFGVQPGADKQANLKFGPESSVAATTEKTTETKGFSFGTVTTNKKDESVPAEAPKETGGFKFGSTIESSKKADSEMGGFKFGASVQPAKATETAGFKFGSSLGSSGKPEEASAGFKFGAEPAKVESVAPKLTSSIQTVKSPEESKLSFATEFSSKKSEVEPSLTFKSPPLSSQGPSGFSIAATTTTSASKASPIFSFGKSPAVPDSSKVSTLETGSVMDILGKKPATTVEATPTTAPPAFSFVAGEQAKPSFSFAKPAPSADKSLFAFGAASEESSTAKSTPSFSFSATPSTTSSASMPKPTAAQSFSFGSTTATAFGAAVTTASTTPSFGSLPPIGSSTPSFSLPVTTATSSFGASTTSGTPAGFGVPTASSASTPFGIPTSSTATFAIPSTTAAPSATFGLSSSAAPKAFGIATTPAAPTAFGISTTSAAPPPAYGVATTTATAATAPSTGSAAPASSLFTFGAVGSGATPTATTSAGAAPSTSFSFGLASSSSSAASPFAFGSAPPPYPFGKEAQKPASSGFAFNAPSTSAPTAAAAPAAPGIFTFGASSAAPVSAAPSTTTPSEPSKLFTFGASQQTTPATPVAPTFGSFGASGAKPASTPFAFGASTPVSSTPAFGDVSQKSLAPFGAPTVAAVTPFGSAPATGFGAPASTPSSASPFTFGAPSSTAPAFSQTPSFSFGAAAAPAATPQQHAAPSVFQFGNAAAGASAVNSGFSFGSSAPFTTPDGAPPGFPSGFGSPANPFEMTGGASNSNRRIRKAVRRR